MVNTCTADAGLFNAQCIRPLLSRIDCNSLGGSIRSRIDSMPNEEHISILKQGVEVWNRWRKEVPDVRPCLNGADLRGLDFSIQDPVSLRHRHASKFMQNLYRQRQTPSDLGVDLHDVELNSARLNEANLFRANLTRATLHRTKLTGATLREALLVEADLSDATIEETDLRKAKLHSASLQGANLRYANLTGASLSQADLTGADLSWADIRGVEAHDSILNDTNLSYANLTKADLWGARLRGADLTQSQLVFTNLMEADITGCKVFGVSAWGVHLSGTNQSDLVITRKDQPVVTVDNLEVAQFIYLLLNNEKVRDIIDTIGKKGVLIIGRFTEERKAILHAIGDELRNLYGLLPIMFEFDPLPTEPTIKTLSTLAHLSRFVIADLTDAKSILQELTKILHELPTLPVQPILHESAEMPPMGDSFLVMQSVLEPYVYSTKQKLIADLSTEVVGPAQNWANKMESKLAEVRQKWLPWQSK